MAIKIVKFDYFRVHCLRYDQEENVVRDNGELFDLTPILSRAMTLRPTETTYNYNGEDARLQRIEKNTDDPFWKMQFLRIRKDILPGIANDEGDYNQLDLEDDEWIGEEVAVLYDESRYVLMLQRNRNSLSVSGLEKYFNYVLNDPTYIIRFKPIPLPENYRTISSNELFRKVTINFTNTAHLDELLPQGSSLLNVIKSANSFGAINVSLTLSVGRGATKDRTLNANEIMQLSHLVDIEGFTKLEVCKKQHEDTKVEVVDLIQGKLSDEEKMEYSRENPIEYSRVIRVMLNKYNDRVELLDKLFNM